MTQIKLRRDTSANFTSKNPVLGVGEPAYETDTKKLKIGDGTTAYTQLEYFSTGGGLEVKNAKSANFNSSELLETGLYYISGGFSPQNAPTPYAVSAMLITMKRYAASNAQTIQQTWIGCEDLVANQIYTRYSQYNGVMTPWVRVDSNKIASASALGSVKIGEGLTISPDGTLSASGGGSAPSNMVTTDTSQDITGKKSFTTGKITFKNTDSNRKILGEINGNGFYCNYYTDKASGEKPCYLGKVGRDTFNMGIPDLTGVNGRIFARTLTKWDGISEVGTILDSSNLGSYVDGTTITYTNNKLSATGGSSGLEVCDIGMALYIDETKGLRRHLNGQIVDINTNSQEFLNRLKEITTLHPSLLCTEEEWQTAKTMSAFGQVGKFVFNYSGNEIVSVRLPRVVNVQGLFDLQNLGMTVQAGLPNIKGSLTGNRLFGQYASKISSAGALELSTTTSATSYSPGSSGNFDTGFSFDASRSNPIYGKSNTVQPEAIQYPYFIQIATGSETENNIINEIELNNPYSLFDHKYSDHELNNLSWLKSEGQWNAKAVYTDAYDKLLKIYNGTETVEGLSVKLSTETYTDYDFVLNTAEETFRLPLRTLHSDDTVDSLSLYFYVGETVQNANLIDAGRIGEQLASLTTVVETYKNGTSWYRVWSDGWCEQGGYLSENGVISFLKPFSNTDYTLVFGASGVSNGLPRDFRQNRTTSSFEYKSANAADTPTDWYACGYIK